MQWQLGILGTISAFAFRHRETKKNLCRDEAYQLAFSANDLNFLGENKNMIKTDTSVSL